jgi:hypothetical protein
MKNIFAMIGLLTVSFVALGWYFGWYRVEKQATTESGHSRFQIDVDTQKINKDIQRGVERGSELIDSIREKSKAKSESDSSTVPVSTPKDSPKEGWKPISTNISMNVDRFNLKPIPEPR